MVWMPLMNKKNMRRRKSQSPSSSSDSSSKLNSRSFFTSKHKRRSFQRGMSGVTEVSSLSSKGSGLMDNAPWRVENIRESVPTAEEWWDDACAPETLDFYKGKDGDSTQKILISSRISSRHKKFHNCGYETWVRAREEWKQQTVEVVPEKPNVTEKERAHLVKGLRKASTQRTYALPRNIALPDMIGIYNDIWDGDIR